MSGENSRGGPLVLFGIGMAILSLAFPLTASANLVIDANFDSSITGNADAFAIEGAIDTAISNMEALYGNNVTMPVTFTYNAAGGSNLLTTTQTFYDVSYNTYESALQSDAAAHPTNLVLSTAIANLSHGNDANGADDLALTAAQLNMLTGNTFCSGSACAGGITININSNQNFSFAEPTLNSQYDLIGGLEHELDETLGGGGRGSTLNAQLSCPSDPTGFFCNKFGPLDLLRYSAPGTPSFTTSSSATAYLSINGGLTPVVSFNQNSAGDLGDFAIGSTGDGGQLIQNAFTSMGPVETYTTSSPEFTMMEAIGWDPAATVSEPSTVVLIGAGLALIGIARRGSA